MYVNDYISAELMSQGKVVIIYHGAIVETITLRELNESKQLDHKLVAKKLKETEL